MNDPVIIPEILKTRLMNQGKRFLRVSKGNKSPIDEGWNKEENRMEGDDPRLIAWCGEGGGAGFVCAGMSMINGYGMVRI